jgi:hypothetical protein
MSSSSAAWPLVLEQAHGMGHEGRQSIAFMPHSIHLKLQSWCKTSSRGCPVCQRNKTKHLHPGGLLQPLTIPSSVWADIAMNFVEGFPKAGGKSVILTVMDRFSKYAHFIPLGHSYSATTVAKAFFDQVVWLHGIPLSIVSDRDPVFTSMTGALPSLRYSATHELRFLATDRWPVGGNKQGDHDVSSLPRRRQTEDMAAMASLSGVLLQYLVPNGPRDDALPCCLWPCTTANDSLSVGCSQDHCGGPAAAQPRCVPSGSSGSPLASAISHEGGSRQAAQGFGIHGGRLGMALSESAGSILSP